MVNAFGYYASAKGMVAVPDLSGLTRTQAIAAIAAANLTYVDGGSAVTGNSALDDFVVSQLPNASDLVDYGTEVSFIYYDFVPAPPFFPSFPTPPSVSLTATATGETSVSISWVVSNFNQVSVLFQRDGETFGDGALNTTDTSSTNGGLTCNTNYTYTVVIYDGPNGTGNSITASASVTTNACSVVPTTWYCSYNGTDGTNRSIQSSDLTDTSSCDYAVVCSTSGYPPYQPYTPCTPTPGPTPTPTTWYCSYNGTDGTNQSTQSSNLTDTSNCDYAINCSTSGYPPYPPYTPCTPTPGPTPTPTPTTCPENYSVTINGCCQNDDTGGIIC